MAETLTNARVVRIAGPIVLSNATIPILGAVDTAVIGQMGDATPIAAVGLGAIILGALYWIFGFLRMGTTGFVAQALGQGDKGEAAVILARALLIAGLAGLALVVLQRPLFAGAFMVAPASPEAEAMARSYMSIRVWSGAALISLYATTGWLIAAEKTGAVLVIQLTMNGVNVVLDILFVLGFGWGIEGVAWATVIAECTGAGLGLWYCRAAFATPGWRNWAAIANRSRLARFMQVNSDILLRSLLLQAMFLSFTFFGARYGDVTLAANHILLQFLYITSYALDGIAFAAETLVGQAVGGRNRARLRRAVVLCAIWGAGAAGALSLGFAVFGKAIIEMMTTAADVQQTAGLYLIFMVAAPLLGAASWVLDGVFIGATRARDMRNMMAISAAIYFVAAFALMPVWGNAGLWSALLLGFVARGVTLGLRYPALERSVRPVP